MDPTRNRDLIEGIARVVSVEGGVAVLEPEQTTACGHCVSASVCGQKGGLGDRLVARRFEVPGDGLAVGERWVIGISERSLLRASMAAYGLPLLTLLGGGVAAQAMGAGDGVSALASVGGLGIGFLLARWRARSLEDGGDLSPTLLHRAGSGDMCHTE